MAKGKYSEWLTSDGLLLLEGWARDGLTDEQIAKKIGIAPKTLYQWINRFVQIGNAIKKGKAPVDFEVENALLKRALGYEYKEIIKEINNDGKQNIREVTKHMPPDVGAAVFWLKNRRRDKWRDRPDLAPDKTEGNEILDSISDVLIRRRDEHD